MSGATLDVPYPSGFYPFQAPVLIDYVALIRGLAPVRAAPRQSFDYLDLGCGDAFTLIALAAVHPEGRFFGIDLNPEHIARGRALAEIAGLTNVTLIEGNFGAWRDYALPSLDYIALHGVWAWIPEEARDAIVALAADRLRPGGALYVSYNAYPGWAAIAPLRQFILDWTRGREGDPIALVADAVSALRELRQRGGAFLSRTPDAVGMLEEMTKKDPRYVAHEIYSPHWSPQPFSAVAERLAPAGLVFAGSADLRNLFARTAVKAELQPLVARHLSRPTGELLIDHANNTFFRRDVFLRSAVALTSAQRLDALAQLPFGAKAPSFGLANFLALPHGRMPLQGPPYDALLAAFSDGGTATLETLLARPDLARLQREAVLDGLLTLSVGQQVVPFLASAAPVRQAPSKWTVPLALNRHLLANPINNDKQFTLVLSPIAGTAVLASLADAAILVAGQGRGAAALEGRLRKWSELGVIAPI